MDLSLLLLGVVGGFLLAGLLVFMKIQGRWDD